jgi:carbohydrate binding protein with CBM4/9 domain
MRNLFLIHRKQDDLNTSFSEKEEKRGIKRLSRWSASVVAVFLLGIILIVRSAAPVFAGAPYSCTVSGDGTTCGDYTDTSNENMSNGFNTYLANNCWADPSCSQTLEANSPQDWAVVANEPADNTSVKTGPELQQQMNDWCSDANTFGTLLTTGQTCGTNEDTPLSGLESLDSTYADTIPRNAGTTAEWAWDIWTNYGQDIMVWVDNQNVGNGGATLMASGLSIDGKTWDLYRNGGVGGELIFSLDGSGGTGTYAQDSSDTVDLVPLLQYVEDAGYVSDMTISLIDWTNEIRSTGGSDETFTTTNFNLIGTPGTHSDTYPAVTEDSASTITSSGANLSGTVNPRGESTTYQFQYGTDTSYGNEVPTTAGSVGSGSSPVSETATLTGLTSSTIYHYRLVATNSTGTTYGQDMTFTTSFDGTYQNNTFEDSGTDGWINWFSTTLSNITTEAHDGTHSLEIASSDSFWGIQESVGHSVTAGDPVKVTGYLKNSATSDSGISVKALYNDPSNQVLNYSQVNTSDNSSGWTEFSFVTTPPSDTSSIWLTVADSNGGTHYLDDVKVAEDTTDQSAPVATSDAATSVTSSGATLHGAVNPEGADTTYKFDYGTDSSFGSSTTAVDAGSGSSSINESADLTDLTNGITYYYRIEATNSAGTTYGATETFTTPTETTISDKTFGDGTDHMTNWFSTSVSQTTDTAYTGSNSLEIDPTDEFWGIEEDFPQDGGSTAVTEGQNYLFTAQAKAASDPANLEIEIHWLGDANNDLGDVILSPVDTDDSASSWTQYQTDATAPTGAVAVVWSIAGVGNSTQYIGRMLVQTP